MADAGHIDESLLVRVASLSRGGQRWLKTAILAIQSGDIGAADDVEVAAKPPAELPRIQKKPPANLEDVITGKADLRDQLEAYPELSNELEGLADVIDLLREAGERRRTRGEDILRELLEGDGERQERNEDAAEEEESEEDDDGGNKPPRRPRR